MLFNIDIGSHRTFNAKYIQNDAKKNGSLNAIVIVHYENTSLLRSFWNYRKKTSFLDTYIYEWRVSCVYVYVYINIYIFMRECVRVQIVKREAVIFKSLKYTVPSLTRSRDSLISIVSICWKHLSFQERKVSTKFKRSKR